MVNNLKFARDVITALAGTRKMAKISPEELQEISYGY